MKMDTDHPYYDHTNGNFVWPLLYSKREHVGKQGAVTFVLPVDTFANGTKNLYRQKSSLIT